MIIKKTKQLTDQIEENIADEGSRNKIFVILLGFLILGMAFFGKVINDSANDAFEKVEQHFLLSNDYLSYIFDTYSCVTVDGIVKTAHGIKDQNQVLKEMKEKFPIAKEKFKFYLANTCCHQKDILHSLEKEFVIANDYWDKIIKNYESGNAINFATETLESGELYQHTDEILLNINKLLDCHLETAKKENDKCQKSLKSFKRICIVSSSIGFTIIVTVIIKYFSEKNEKIQKRNINNRPSPRRKPRKKIIQNKK